MRDIRFLLKTRYTNSRALIIGINTYRNASPLSYAVNDAAEVRETLQVVAGFPPQNITYLADADASKANILKAFFRYTKDDIDLDDRILVFFAGHGHTRTGSRGEIGYLVPFDADMADFSTFIRWDELTRNADLIRAKHVFFVMDACYGGLALTRHLHAGSTRFLKDMLLRQSRQVLTAGKADELVADSGGPLPGHSVFTGHFIEGLRGKAATEGDVITAGGIMAYVYGKVANDKNSNQTPHYGHFDGDGDFIITAPHLSELEGADSKDLDSLVVIPYPEQGSTAETTQSKVQRVKSLLASDASSIELHDFVIEEVRAFLAATSDDSFPTQGNFADDEFLRRISKYEQVCGDLTMLLACIAYWARPIHTTLLQKSLARSTDRLEARGGLVAWTALRWYPMLLELYSAGIAAVDGKRFDSLATIFYASVPDSEYRSRHDVFVNAVASGVLDLHRAQVFKRLPGHERNFVPLSEYLFKILQPKLDDTLFMGKNYERSFDEFEVFFGLAVADWRKVHSGSAWGPIGRFGWKHSARENAPLIRIVTEGRAAKQDWEPLKAGLFGGSYERFEAVADEYTKAVSTLGWH